MKRRRYRCDRKHLVAEPRVTSLSTGPLYKVTNKESREKKRHNEIFKS